MSLSVLCNSQSQVVKTSILWDQFKCCGMALRAKIKYSLTSSLIQMLSFQTKYRINMHNHRCHLKTHLTAPCPALCLSLGCRHCSLYSWGVWLSRQRASGNALVSGRTVRTDCATSQAFPYSAVQEKTYKNSNHTGLNSTRSWCTMFKLLWIAYFGSIWLFKDHVRLCTLSNVSLLKNLLKLKANSATMHCFSEHYSKHSN